MKYYLVMNKNGNFKGFTNDKKTLYWFLEQRNIKNYKVIEADETQLNESFKKEIHSSYKEIVVQAGTLLFEDEEQVYIDYISDYIIRLESSVNKFSSLLEYFKFDNPQEELIVKKAIEIISDITSYIVDCEDSIEYELFIEVNKMMKEIIKQQD